MNDVAHRRWWQTFEVVAGLPCALAIALHLRWPVQIVPGGAGVAVLIAGGALIVAGCACVIATRQQFRRSGQPTDPGHPTGALMTAGMFARSRNPLYLGGVLVLLGLALVANSVWGVLMLLPALVTIHCILIAPEERYLAAQFGAAYTSYAATVCRWFGRRTGTLQ